MPSEVPAPPEPPELPALKWSISVDALTTGANLYRHTPDTLLRTASVGKIFLLTEVCTRFADGRLDPDARLRIPAEHEVADSGLLYLFRDRAITLGDACLLVGAVSDNLATNALIALVGLDNVRAVAPAQGLENTTLLDYIRDGRDESMPWTPSYGTARELSAMMRRLWAGQVVSPEVSRAVLHYLAADADVSMVAGGFHLDSLAHIEPDDGLTLRHKTGSDSCTRIDVGLLDGPAGGISYAVGANWYEADTDYRLPVEDYMHELGRAIREAVRPD